MSRAGDRRTGPGVMDLIEEAAHLLRRAPPTVLACYYLGSLPFVLGLLYFWADMSRSATARERCTEASLALALLFVWMKAWQAIACSRLLAYRLGERPARWTPGRIAHVVVSQMTVQATGVFLLPVAALFTVPLGWVYAFYQSATCIGDSSDEGLSGLVRGAWGQAVLWPRQNHLVLTILTVIGLLVFLNLAIAIVVAPGLLKSLLGIETAFSRSIWSVANTTFLAVACCLTYLCVDPLTKTIYALRCFYGRSLRSGQDLLAELRGTDARGGARGGLVACLVFTALLWSNPAPGAAGTSPAPDAAGPESHARVSPVELDREISRVLGQREYAWRLPRDTKGGASEPGFLAAFLQDVWSAVEQGVKTVGGWIRAVVDWLESLFPDPDTDSGDRNTGQWDWIPWLRWLLVIALVVLVATLVLAFLRRRGRRTQVLEASLEPTSPHPDLADEDVRADQLPPDDWMTLAKELFQKGDSRLGLRALYLAGLAHLSQQGLLIIARHKSNRDYATELARRSHVLPDVVAAFSGNVGMFDRIWYGTHAVTGELTRRFAANHQRIMGVGAE